MLRFLISFKIIAVCAMVCMVVASGTVARADLLNGWTFDDPDNSDASFSATVTTLQLTGGDNQSTLPGVATYTQVATIGGTVAFDWSSTSVDDPGFDFQGYVVNGVLTSLSTGDDSGSDMFDVNSGDTFGFYVETVDGLFGPIIANYSNYSFTAVPEPTSLVILGFGSMMGFIVRRRR